MVDCSLGVSMAVCWPGVSHGHLAGLGLLGDGDGDGQHAVLVAGVHLGGVEAVAEEQLAAEGAVDALIGDDVVALDGTPGALGADGEDVALVFEVDGGGIDAGQIEVSDERVAVPVGVHREAGPLELVAGLLQGAVDLTEGIEPKQHRHGSYLLSQVGLSLVGPGRPGLSSLAGRRRRVVRTSW